MESFKTSLTSEWSIRARAMSIAFCVASSSSSKTMKSTGTDFRPTREFIPRRYRNEVPICLRFAVSVSTIHLPTLSGFSSTRGEIRPLEKSVTSVREGKR